MSLTQIIESALDELDSTNPDASNLLKAAHVTCALEQIVADRAAHDARKQLTALFDGDPGDRPATLKDIEAAVEALDLPS